VCGLCDFAANVYAYDVLTESSVYCGFYEIIIFAVP